MGQVQDTYGDEVYEIIPVVDVFFDVDGKWGAHQGLEKEGVVVGIVGRRGRIPRGR